jgi:tRNA 2-selenouridine synthase
MIEQDPDPPPPLPMTKGATQRSEVESASRQHAARGPLAVNVTQLTTFDEVIDVRSESEYAEDHIPGAINCPVLDDRERALVGTIYKQTSSFEAKKVGAALASMNIARHLRERFHDRPKSWRPLVYCWRGGARSAALARVLSEIGWRVGRLEGGYKAYRRAVVADLEHAPRRFEWRVVCGLTGTGKSRLLRALHAAGAQVLDLEALARHRGSVLGNIPDALQPPQKMFESLVWHALARFDSARPIYVEGESRKIGRLRVPEALIETMWASECILVDAALDVRTQLLKSEYAHFALDPELLAAQLDCLAALHGRETIARWQALARAGTADALVEELLLKHYDPAYVRSTLAHYPNLSHAPRFVVAADSDESLSSLASDVLRSTGERRQHERYCAMNEFPST